MDTMLSLLLERTLELMLKKNNIDASPERIKEALNSTSLTEFTIEGRHMFYLKTQWYELSNKICKILCIKPPKDITPFGELKV